MFNWLATVILLVGAAVLPAQGGDGLKLSGGPAGNTAVDARELRVIPVSPLVQPLRDAFYPQFGRILGGRAWEARPDNEAFRPWPIDDFADPDGARFLFPSVEDLAPMPIEFVVDRLLAESPEAWDSGNGSIQALGTNLYVVHNRTELDAVAAALERYRLEVVPRYEYSYVLYEVADGEPDAEPSRLDLESARALLARVLAGKHGRAIYSARAEGRLGDALGLGEDCCQGLMTDVDVEIAQEASIGDPVVQKLLLGHRLVITPTPAPDGRGLVFFGQFTWRDDPADLRQVDMSSGQLKATEEARLEQIQAAFSAHLPGDGGLLLRPGGARKPGLRVLLVVHRLDPLPKAIANQAVLPLHVLSWPALTCEHEGLLLAGLGTGRMDSDTLAELVRAAVGDDDESLSCQVRDMFLWVSGRPEKVAAARDLVAFLARRNQRSFRVEVIREARPAGDPAAPWQRFGCPIEILCLGGRVGFAQAGAEQLFTGDWEVEVAQKQKIGDPQVVTCFDGVQLAVSVEPQAEDLDLRLALLDRSLLGFRVLPVASPELGPCRTPILRETVFRRSYRLRPGETQVLGDGPLRAARERGLLRTRLSLRVTEL